MPAHNLSRINEDEQYQNPHRADQRLSVAGRLVGDTDWLGWLLGTRGKLHLLGEPEDPKEFQRGEKIWAFYDARGEWQPARIDRVENNGTYVISWDEKFKAELIKQPHEICHAEYKISERVYAKRDDGTWSHARIDDIRQQPSASKSCPEYIVEWDDGHRLDKKKTPWQLRNVEDYSDLKKALHRMSTRSTTDAACYVFFLLFWFVMLCIAIWSLHHGDNRRLMHGLDYHGRLCGIDEGVSDKPLLYWPQPGVLHMAVCVDSCPSSFTEQVSLPRESVSHVTRSSGELVTDITVREEWIDTYPCRRVGDRFCLPASGSQHGSLKAVLHDQLSSLVEEIRDHVEDLANAWVLLVIVVPFSIGLGYFYLVVLRYCAWSLTWGLLAAAVLVTGASASYCLRVAESSRDSEALIGDFTGAHDPSLVLQALGFVLCTLCVLSALSAACLYYALAAVIGMIQVSCMAMLNLPHLMKVPLQEIALKTAFLAVWLFCFSFVMTAGELGGETALIADRELSGMIRPFWFTTQEKIHMGVFVVGLFWGLETLGNIVHFAVCWAVSLWYFTPDEVDRPEISKEAFKGHKGANALQKGAQHAVRWHLGSLALGAAISLTFRPVRFVLEFLAARVHSEADNEVVKTLVETCLCFVECFLDIVAVINRNAINHLVLCGTPWVQSAQEVTKLLQENSAEAVNMVGVTFVYEAIGIALISISSAGGVFWLCKNLNQFGQRTSSLYLEDPLEVSLVAGIIAALVSTSFMLLFDTVSDCLMFCMFTDMQDGHMEHAPDAVKHLLDDLMKGYTHFYRLQHEDGSPGEDADPDILGSRGRGEDSHTYGSQGRHRQSSSTEFTMSSDRRQGRPRLESSR